MRTGSNLEVTGYHPLGPGAFVVRIVDFLFGLLTLVLLVRFALELIDGSANTAFGEFIGSISDPFLLPFRGIVGATTIGAGHHVVWSIVVAVIAYALLHTVIHGFFRVVSRA
jgi:uncharacterized protein YggT (Ycf19 family)